jgi:hypothetical protein
MPKSESDNRTGKLINLPDEVWAALQKDADRCRRSLTKQLEAMLVAFYKLDNVDIGNVGAMAIGNGQQPSLLSDDDEPQVYMSDPDAEKTKRSTKFQRELREDAAKAIARAREIKEERRRRAT